MYHDLLIPLISTYMSTKNGLKMRQVCKMAYNEFSYSALCNWYNFTRVSHAFQRLKKTKFRRRRRNTWRRKLHTDDEIILLF